MDAVESAVAIQRALKTHNADLPAQRQMHYRLGINVGDVVVEGERIYGDGVNIAARLESLAEGGGVAISGTVYDQVKNKLPLDYTYQGEQHVNNIADPVRMYRLELNAESVTPVPEAQPSAQAPVLNKLDKLDIPSLAVLPFTNMSTDPEQEYFSDGMTEDLITDLSKISGLFVIARNSVFAYKGEAVDIGEVSRKLGVQYVLEGSVRKAGQRVRINAQLINATTGGHEWAERYDRELEDIFDLQDEMTHRIAFALKVTLTSEEQARFRQAPTTNLDAYDCYLRGSEVSRDFTQERNTRARQLFEQAISLDPDYAAAYALLGLTHWTDWSHQWSSNPPQSLQQAFDLAQKAVALDNSLPVAHRILGFVSLWHKDYTQALVEGEHAVALGPSDAESLGSLGDILNFIGRPVDGLKMIEQAIRLNPHHPVYYHFWRAHTYYLMEQYEEAIAAGKSVLMLNPSILPAHLYLTASYSEDGREEDAHAAGTEFRRCLPQVSLQFLEQMLPYKDPAVTLRLLTALRKAGLE